MTQLYHDKIQSNLKPINSYIKAHFYKELPEGRYHQDKKMLLYAITWPATWLQKYNLKMTSKHYNQLLMQRLNEIEKYGNPKNYMPYFPRYFLKVMQEWFHHNGDSLYDRIKHTAYIINDIMDHIQKLPQRPQESDIEILSQAHFLLKQQYKRKKMSDSKQMIFDLYDHRI